MYYAYLSHHSFKGIIRVVVVLSIAAVMSCNKTDTTDVSPQVPLTERQYSLEVAKALYSAIQLDNYNLKVTKKNLVDNVTEHKNDVIRNSANSLLSNEKFNKLFVSSSARGARSSADNIGTLNLEAIQNEINSPTIPAEVRKRLLQLSRQLDVVKSNLLASNISDPDVIKNAIGAETAKFEDEIKNDQIMSSDEKSMVFSFTIPIYDNLNNIKDMLTRTSPNGRLRCFLCNVLNVFITVVVAVVVVTVAVVGIFATGGALAGVAAPLGAYATVGMIGAAIGAITGIAYVSSNTCIVVSDYNQQLFTANGFLGLASGQC